MNHNGISFQTLETSGTLFPDVGSYVSRFSRHGKLVGALLFCAFAAAAFSAHPGDYHFVGWTVGETDGSAPNILCTTNGTTWFQQGGGQVPAIHLYGVAVIGSKIWVVGEAYEGYGSIYHSGDDGATWTRQGDATGFPDVGMSKCWAVDNQVVWAVGDSGTVFRTLNGGADWQNVSVPFFSNHLQAITAVDADTAWVGGVPDPLVGFAGVFHTTNGGASWTRQTQGGVTNVHHVLGLAAVDAHTVWGIGGNHQDIISTTNGGALWEQKYRGAENRDGNEICVAPDGSIWAATDSTLLWSTNNGADWNSQGVADFTMDVDTPDGQHVWAVRDNYDGGIIYYSPDAGVTWTQQVDGGVPGLQTVTMQRRAKTYPIGTRFVWTNSPSPAAPYTNWATAAHTIQAAVDAASEGDLVLVADGVYNTGSSVSPGGLLSSRVVIARGVTVRSLNGPEETIIEGAPDPDTGGLGPGAVRCVFISSNAVLNGFTLRHGHTWATGGDENSERGGAGVLFYYGGTVSNCVIEANEAAMQGGGANMHQGGVLTYSIVRDNIALRGGGILCERGHIRNCLVYDNLARSMGGGVYFLNPPSLLESSTVVSNTAVTNAGGVFFWTGCTSLNSIVYFNATNDWSMDSGGVMRFTCAPDAPEGFDNVTNAPLFLAGSYRPFFGSAVISAGTNQPWMVGAADFDGFARIVDGATDLGAYEYDGDRYDSDGDGIPDNWEVRHGLDPTNPADAFDDYDGDGFTNYEEWIADTNPRDEHSFFHLVGIDTVSSFEITFVCTNSRLYSLYFTTNLVDGPWLPVSGQLYIPGAAHGVMSLADTNETPFRAYRVEVSR